MITVFIHNRIQTEPELLLLAAAATMCVGKKNNNSILNVNGHAKICLYESWMFVDRNPL